MNLGLTLRATYVPPPPGFFSEVRILKGLKKGDFVSADCKGVTGAFFVSADSKEVIQVFCKNEDGLAEACGSSVARFFGW